MKISLIEAQNLLERGHVVAIPTETVYGLGALLKFPGAIDQIYTLKGRPSNNPLIIHVASTKEIAHFVPQLPPDFDVLAKTFWPGSMTVVLPILPDLIPEKARAGLPTAAFRIPNHPEALKLLAQCGPIVMPSANLSGRPSATFSEHVEADFGCDFPILEGSRPCLEGVESTILLFIQDRWAIIRLGALEPEIFQSVLGYCPNVTSIEEGKLPLCPGQMHRHYAPRTQLILLDTFVPNLEGVLLGFKNKPYSTLCRVLEMGSLNSPKTVAENLYAVLRQLDQLNVETAYVDMSFPKEGLWLTIAERLMRAGEPPYNQKELKL